MAAVLHFVIAVAVISGIATFAISHLWQLVQKDAS